MRTGAILLATYSRPKELSASLNSIVNQVSSNKPKLIVIHQKGNELVSKVIQKFREDIDFLVEIDALGKSPLENINYNRILGYELCFNFLKMDFVLAIEEDIVISHDAYDFCEKSIDRYWNTPKFNGVNLGSFEVVEEASRNTYSKLSYGIHGQASAITKKVWQKIDTNQAIQLSTEVGFDAQVENLLKRGFFVTSNASRYLDFGWEGTHAAKNQNDPYYVKLKNSWVGDFDNSAAEFKHEQIPHTWRNDAIPYGIWSQVKSQLIRTKTFVRNSIMSNHEN